MLFERWSDVKVPVIGMLHSPPLPGSPGYDGLLTAVHDKVLQDAQTLADCGVDGLMLENFGDVPFFPDRVPAITVAAMTTLAVAIRTHVDVPLGINVLRNDGRSALAIAAACGAQFLRVNVLSGARVTDQGLIQGIAHELLRDRKSLRADSIRILADVDVKHSVPVTPLPIEEETRDLIERARADAVIVSGTATGRPTDTQAVTRVSQAAGATPVFVGSGVTADSVCELIRAGATGLIVGSSLKRDGILSNPVDADQCRRLMDAVRAAVG